MQIAYQGIAGAFGEQATVQHFGESVARIGLASFADVFDAVATGRAAAGVVPIENSLAGSILDSYDLLLDHELNVIGEVNVAVRHCLLAAPRTELPSITHAHSHPQALAQCAPFLAAHGITAVVAANTAVAARDVAASGEPGAAAIASTRAGTIYGLVAVASDIQTRGDNTTRFFVIARGMEHSLERDAPPNKASLALATRNQPGALLACLEVFAALDLNLTKLESRPTGDVRWEYVFSIDIEAADRGELSTAVVDAALEQLRLHTSFVRLLGRYARS